MTNARPRGWPLALFAASVLALSSTPVLANISLSANSPAEEATRLEEAGEFKAAAELWAEQLRTSLDPLMLFYADSGWARAFAKDGNSDHLCARLELSEWLLAQPSLSETDRAEARKLRAHQLSALPEGVACSRSKQEAPLLAIPPRNTAGTADNALAPQGDPSRNSPLKDDGKTIRDSRAGRGLRISGGVLLTSGVLFGAAAIATGLETRRTITDLETWLKRHAENQTIPTASEREEKRSLYRHGEVAAALALGSSVAAVLALSVGTALLIRGRKSRTRRAALAPAVGPQNVGVTLRGNF